MLYRGFPLRPSSSGMPLTGADCRESRERGRRYACPVPSAKNLPVAAPATARDDRRHAVFEDAAIPESVVAVFRAVADPISRPRVQPYRGVSVRPLPSVVMAMMMSLGVSMPGLPMNPAVVPLALMIRRAMVHPRVMTMPGVLTGIEGSQHRAGADRDHAAGLASDNRADQSTDDTAHQRLFQQPHMVGPSGCCRHGRGERDGSRERDPADNAPSPAPLYRHFGFPIAGLRTDVLAIEAKIRRFANCIVRGSAFPINQQSASMQ